MVRHDPARPEPRRRRCWPRRRACRSASVSCMTIWGNHSDTQYPDYKNARIGGKPATEVIARRGLVHRDLHPDGGQARRRGDQGPRRIVGRLGGQCRHRQRPLAPLCPTPTGDWFSAAVVSDGSYGIPAGLIYSFPLVSKGDAAWSIVAGLPIDDEARTAARRLGRRAGRRARRRQGAARPGTLTDVTRAALGWLGDGICRAIPLSTGCVDFAISLGGVLSFFRDDHPKSWNG